MKKFDKNKPFFLKFADEYFIKGEILWIGNKTYVLVMDAFPKNTLWQRFKRLLGIKIFNPKGYIKVIKYEKKV